MCDPTAAKKFTYSEPRRRDAVPKKTERPVMGLKSEKNFITSNAIENILAKPKRTTREQPDYTKKPDYGRVGGCCVIFSCLSHQWLGCECYFFFVASWKHAYFFVSVCTASVSCLDVVSCHTMYSVAFSKGCLHVILFVLFQRERERVCVGEGAMLCLCHSESLVLC